MTTALAARGGLHARGIIRASRSNSAFPITSGLARIIRGDALFGGVLTSITALAEASDIEESCGRHYNRGGTAFRAVAVTFITFTTRA